MAKNDEEFIQTIVRIAMIVVGAVLAFTVAVILGISFGILPK